jgi:hypothetical protein
MFPVAAGGKPVQRPLPSRDMPKPSPRPGRPFSRQPLTRQHLRDIVQRAVEPLPYAHALWEGGAAAFDRADAWSDVDLQICVDDDRVEDAFAAVESALEKDCGIEMTFPVPEPTWHGHAQRFYRFTGQPPWLLLDLCVQRRSNERRFLEKEIHGKHLFLFDRIGLGAAVSPADPDARERQLRERLAFLRARTGMFAHMVEKECRRQHPIDAFTFYQGMVLAPLVELLRIRHDPWRYNFGLRYLHRALPGPLVKRVEDLCFIRNFPDLQTKCRTALRWFDELAAELERAPRLIFSTGSAPARTPKPVEAPA